MIPSDLKEFEKFLKICRKQGVTEITHQDISVKFTDYPLHSDKTEVQEEVSETLSGDDLLYYHVNGGIL